MKEIKQLTFSGGLTDNIRDQSGSTFWSGENLEIKSDAVRQTEYMSRDFGTFDNDYAIGKLIEVEQYIYGLGQNNTTDKKATLYKKQIGVTSNFVGYTPSTAYQNTIDDPLLVYDNGFIYFLNGTYISSYEIATNTMVYNWSSLSGVTTNNVAQGGVMWQGNIYSYSVNTVYQTTVATATTIDKIAVPSSQTVEQLIPYGNYLMIVCSAGSKEESKVYLWDGVTTTTFTDIISVGMNIVAGGAIKDGVPYIVTTNNNGQKISILRYNGNHFVTVATYSAKPNRAKTFQYIFPASKIKSFRDNLYFLAMGTKSDSTITTYDEAQIFRFGKIDVGSLDSLSCIAALDTTVSGGGTPVRTLNDVIVTEDYTSSKKEFYICASLYRLTNDYNSSYYESYLNVYTNTSVIETVLFDMNDRSKEKQLRGFSSFYNALPTNGSVTVKYKKDEETTWTTMFTDSTDNSVSHECNNIESTGAELPTFKYIQFRFEFTGGAEIIGYKFLYEELSNSLS